MNRQQATELTDTKVNVKVVMIGDEEIYNILIPSLMVAISLIAPARLNRTLNVVISLIYLASVALSMIGETWIYYLVGSAVEIILLCAIARVAWTWPRQAE